MKRIVSLVMLLVVLGGCASGSGKISSGMTLRERVLRSSSCSFNAVITADFGETVYTFRMACEADREGTLQFSVIEPESISGIKGKLSSSGGEISYEGIVLAFPPLADGTLSPVSGPWLLMRGLRNGYLKSEGSTAEGIVLTIDDSYQDNALQLCIVLDRNDVPVSCDVYFKGRRTLSILLENFSIV